MVSKSVLVEKEDIYSKKDIEKLKELATELKKLQKQKGFREAVREFIKETT